MPKKTANGFERDFGYLMPFLEKVRQAAEGQEPARRQAILALLEGEDERWQKLRSLLAGGQVGSAPPSPRSAGDAPAQAPGSLTVGALKSHPD